MKTRFSLIFLLFGANSSTLFAQKDNIYQMGVVINRIIYRPVDSICNELQKISSYCDNNKAYYFLNGLELNEATFFSLSRNKKFFEQGSTFYKILHTNPHINEPNPALRVDTTTNTFSVHFGSSQFNYTRCIDSIAFYATIKFPIKLNNSFIAKEEETEILSKIQEKDLVSLEIRHPLFRPRYLEIWVKD